MGAAWTSVNQTRPHCVNQIGERHSKPVAARHDRGMALARQGHGMLCVNRPLTYFFGNRYVTPDAQTEVI